MDKNQPYVLHERFYSCIHCRQVDEFTYTFHSCSFHILIRKSSSRMQSERTSALSYDFYYKSREILTRNLRHICFGNLQKVPRLSYHFRMIFFIFISSFSILEMLFRFYPICKHRHPFCWCCCRCFPSHTIHNQIQ